jgi:hypothetical protein
MQVTLEPTDTIVHVNGAPARLWQGTTATGLPVFALISVVFCQKDADASELERCLRELPEPVGSSDLPDAVAGARLWQKTRKP